MTFQTFDESDEEKGLTNKNTMTKTMTMTMTKTKTMTNTFREHLQRAMLETCDI